MINCCYAVLLTLVVAILGYVLCIMIFLGKSDMQPFIFDV